MSMVRIQIATAKNEAGMVYNAQLKYFEKFVNNVNQVLTGVWNGSYSENVTCKGLWVLKSSAVLVPT